MTTKIEIEVEQEECCECDCKVCGDMGSQPAESKDALLAQLKTLLGDNRPNGQADRQLKIDELMSKISEMGKED